MGGPFRLRLGLVVLVLSTAVAVFAPADLAHASGYQSTWDYRFLNANVYSSNECYAGYGAVAGYFNFVRYIPEFVEGDDNWCMVNAATNRDSYLRSASLDLYRQASCCPTPPNGTGYFLGTVGGVQANTHYLMSRFSTTNVRAYNTSDCVLANGYRIVNAGVDVKYNDWAGSNNYSSGLMSFAGTANSC